MFQAKLSFPHDTLNTTPAAAYSFHDVLAFVDHHPEWLEKTRTELKTALRQIAWSIALVQTRKQGAYLDPDRKALDLQVMPFDIPTINQALTGVSYRLAGFNSDKSYRNAKSALRRVGRTMGIVTAMKAPRLPPDNAYAPFLGMANRWNESAARLFAARLTQHGRQPGDVTCADLNEHATFLRTAMVGVNVEATLRRIAKLWQHTARHHPDWPQAPLTLPCPGRRISPLLSLYPVSLQQEIAAVQRWLEGGVQGNPFGDEDVARKPFRPATVAHHLKYIRLMLGVLVEQGTDPATLTSLQYLLVPATAQAILQALWERGQQRRAAMPESLRGGSKSGATGQTHHAGLTLLLLATHRFPQPPAVLQALQRLAKAVRLPKMSQMSRRNRLRLEQFDDPATLQRLLALPHTLMQEALALDQAGRQLDAARLARAAVLFAIEIRIPLRIGNLQSCRLGHNLRFAGARSQMVTLSFQPDETKNAMALEFFVGPRLCALLTFYIQHFLPVFAATSPDWADKQWLFPACEGLPGPLSINQVRKIIIDTAAERVGAVFHPHLFRALAVKLCLQHAPNALEQCRQLLGDKTLDVILRHYAAVQQREAAAHLDRLVAAEEDRLGRLVRVHRKQPGRRGGRS